MTASTQHRHSSDQPDPDDLSLLLKIANHDHQAFETLYQRYQPRLSTYLSMLMQSPAQVEDIVHEVLLVIWQKAAQYRATSPVSTWIFGIARNKALQSYAQQTRRSRLLALPSEPSEVASPEYHMVEQEYEGLLRRALQALPSTQREILELTYEQGYSVQAIATHQDCSTGTVHYRKQQAYRTLATELSW